MVEDLTKRGKVAHPAHAFIEVESKVERNFGITLFTPDSML